MHRTVVAAISAGILIVAAGQSDALPIQSAPAAPTKSSLIETVADGCGPGLIRGRHGTCLVRRAIFSHGRIVRKGCGKPIGAAGLRTPC